MLRVLLGVASAAVAAAAPNFNLFAHEVLNVKPGSSPVDEEGVPVVALWKRDLSAPASTPLHPRVAYGTVPQTEAHFSWTSYDGESEAVLRVGTHSGVFDLPDVVADRALTYTAEELCGPQKNYKAPGCVATARRFGKGERREQKERGRGEHLFPRRHICVRLFPLPAHSRRSRSFFHHAFITGLSPNTRYYVTPTQNGTVGEESTFVTGKPHGPDEATRFVAFGDMYISSGEGAAATCKFLKERIDSIDDLQFLLHIGDLGYGRGDVDVWNTWHNLIAPFSGRIPYHVSIGNHEYSYKGLPGTNDPSGAGSQWAPPFSNVYNDGGGECGVPTQVRPRTCTSALQFILPFLLTISRPHSAASVAR
jgi:Purple acid Phosphatase, N-terminal domain/Calcineurin-like phosphoesterase